MAASFFEFPLHLGGSSGMVRALGLRLFLLAANLNFQKSRFSSSLAYFFNAFHKSGNSSH
jgi:hypothetical protein